MTTSRKQHYVFTFWVVAHYGTIDCTEYFSSKAPTHPPTQRSIEYLPSRWWLGGGWKSAGGVSCCYSWTSLQRPPWEQKKVVVVETWPLVEGSTVYDSSSARLCSKKNWGKPSALNLCNPRRPAFDLYEKRFCSSPRANVRRHRPPGAARVQPWVQYTTSSTSLLTVFCFHFRWWTSCKDLLSFFSLFLCRPIGELQVTGNFFKIFAALVVNCNECRNNKSSDNGCLAFAWANWSAYNLGKW